MCDIRLYDYCEGNNWNYLKLKNKMIQDDKIVVTLDIEQALVVIKGLQLFQDKLKSGMEYDPNLNYDPTLDLTEHIKRYIQSDVNTLYNKNNATIK